MSTIFLPVLASNAAGELEELVPQLLRNDYPLRTVQRVWRSYRVRAITTLFLTGSASGFADDLQKSAQSAVHHLTLRGTEGLALSEITPAIDGMACGDQATGERLARLCLGLPHVSDAEYPDDYLFTRYLLAKWAGDDDASARAVEDLRRLLDGEDSNELKICDSIETANAVALNEAIEARLESHTERYSLLLERGAISEDEWASQGQFSIEGLALIRLASRLGMTLQDNYRFVPSIAIRSSASSAAPDAWREP